MLVNYKKFCFFLVFMFVSLQAPFEEVGKKRFFRLEHWRFSKKAKCLIVFAIIAVMLISVFAFLPKESTSKASVIPQSTSPTGSPTASPTATPSPTKASNPWTDWIQPAGQAIAPPTPKSPGVIETAQIINSTVWRKVAANAWNYFQPGVGVDANTGLPYAGTGGFPYFTDWDLGAYIQAVIDAQEIGLIGTDGNWGSYARLDKVLTFLETRELNSTTGYPYWFYQSADGKDDHSMSDTSTALVDIVDTGRLFVALNNLKAYSQASNFNWTSRINNIVYNNNVVDTNTNTIVNITTNGNGNRSNYAALVPDIKSETGSVSIYSYYYDSGYASFWPQLANVPNSILTAIVNSPNITSPYGNASLPLAGITGDPLLCSVFELNNNSSALLALSKQIYLAHEAYYNATGKYVAFSEGNSPSGFVWEWVVMPDGTLWTAGGSGGSISSDPVYYTKIAFGFLALYNTTFARNMVISLEQQLPDPTNGYSDGADNSGDVVSDLGSNTNSLILDAALYYIQNNP